MTDSASIAIEPSTAEVEAGTEFSITGRVEVAAGCRLASQRLEVADRDGNPVASAGLRPVSGNTFEIAETRLRSPTQAGNAGYRASVRVFAADGREEELTASVAVAVVPHTAIISAWGLPSAVPAGERFGFHVGIKCSCGCNLAGRAFRVLDKTGAEMVAGTVGDGIWPETEGLFFAKVEARAPDLTESPDLAEDHDWTVECAASAEGLPHDAGSFAFTVKVVPAADFEVTVEAFDIDKQQPVTGAHVLLHPYRALTDEQGIARLKVARGSYRLVVSGFKYVPFEDTIDAVADVSARAELKVEPPIQPW